MQKLIILALLSTAVWARPQLSALFPELNLHEVKTTMKSVPLAGDLLQEQGEIIPEEDTGEKTEYFADQRTENTDTAVQKRRTVNHARSQPEDAFEKKPSTLGGVRNKLPVRFQFPKRLSVLPERKVQSPNNPVKLNEEKSENLSQAVTEKIEEKVKTEENVENTRRTSRKRGNILRINPETIQEEEEDENLSESTPRKQATVRNYVPRKYEIEQNKAAKYEFNSNVEDSINGQTQTRSETRDGGTVRGMFSYSDGFFRRTVHYVADDKGYRIISMEAVLLDMEGPKIDLNGSASVSSSANGARYNYRVQSVEAEGPTGKVIGSR